MDNKAVEKPVIGVILAGGLSRRMGGGDKCLISLVRRPILSWIVESLQPQVSRLALNANGDSARFKAFGLPVIADEIGDFPGPLAGILAALNWTASNAPDAGHVLTVPADIPFLPRDLAVRLSAGLAEGAELAIAASGGRRHPVIGLWPLARRGELDRAVRLEGLRKVEAWSARLSTAVVEFSDLPFDPFLNVNTAEDLERAESVAIGFRP